MSDSNSEAPQEITASFQIKPSHSKKSNAFTKPIINGNIGALLRGGTFILLVAGMVASMAVWASGQHADLKEYVINQDTNTQTEVTQRLDKEYVGQAAYGRLEECVKSMKDDMSEMKVQAAETNNKIDKLYDLFWNNRNQLRRLDLESP